MAEEIAPDVTERTTLAGERTLLAWWRTGLASLAVAIAVGRVVPELASTTTIWPYTFMGVAYAAYGVALIIYGSARGRDVELAARSGELSRTRPAVMRWLALAGIALGLGTVGLIIIG